MEKTIPAASINAVAARAKKAPAKKVLNESSCATPIFAALKGPGIASVDGLQV
jgi:hypothetical protein